MLSYRMGPLPAHGFRMRASGETIRMSMPCSTILPSIAASWMRRSQRHEPMGVGYGLPDALASWPSRHRVSGRPNAHGHSLPRPSLRSRNSCEVGTRKFDGLAMMTNLPVPTKPYRKRSNSPVTFRYWPLTDRPLCGIETCACVIVAPVPMTYALRPLFSNKRVFW